MAITLNEQDVTDRVEEISDHLHNCIDALAYICVAFDVLQKGEKIEKEQLAKLSEMADKAGMTLMGLWASVQQHRETDLTYTVDEVPSCTKRRLN